MLKVDLESFSIVSFIWSVLEWSVDQRFHCIDSAMGFTFHGYLIIFLCCVEMVCEWWCRVFHWWSCCSLCTGHCPPTVLLPPHPSSGMHCHGKNTKGEMKSGYSETSDKGHSERGQTSKQRANLVYILYTKEDNLSTKDKMLGPKRVHYSEVPLYTYRSLWLI